MIKNMLHVVFYVVLYLFQMTLATNTTTINVNAVSHPRIAVKTIDTAFVD